MEIMSEGNAIMLKWSSELVGEIGHPIMILRKSSFPDVFGRKTPPPKSSEK